MTKHKQSSDETASVASRVMRMAKGGGPIEANRDALRLALRGMDRNIGAPMERNEAAENETADKLLVAIEDVLRPYFDDAESLAASVVSQAVK